ncbi:MAG: HD family phosphohydrolase, partial [bacterium]|nr:HD family phosphohydrolase [Candidatus Limimorpha equi]
MTNTQIKDEIVRLLKSTKREYIEDVIDGLEELGFFEAPASTKFHLNEAGGLAEHSLNVCKVALMLRKQM